MKSLGEIVNGTKTNSSAPAQAEASAPAHTSEATHEAAAPESAPEQPQATGEAAAPTPGEKPHAPQEVSDHEDDQADDHPVPRKALLAERKRRQEYERQIAELRGQLQVYSQINPSPQQPQAPAPSKPDFYADPEGYVRSQVQSVEAKIQGQYLNGLEAAAREQFPDYDSVTPAFFETAKTQPHLAQQALASGNPALFAYRWAKTYQRAQEYGGSLEEMEKRISEKAIAEYEAKQKKSQALAAAEQANKSPAAARGTGAATAAQFTGPRPLTAILPSDKFTRKRA